MRGLPRSRSGGCRGHEIFDHRGDHSGGTHDLTTLDIAKEELGIDTNENDARLARWIRETSVYIERHCNRVLVKETVREIWHGADYWYLPEVSQEIRPLNLRRYPVVEIASFGSIDEDPPLTADDYQLDAYGDGCGGCTRGCGLIGRGIGRTPP